mgnify:CR=1 FL=1
MGCFKRFLSKTRENEIDKQQSYYSMKFLPTILLLLPLLTACNSELDFDGDTPGTKNAAIGFSNNMKITRAEATLADIQTDTNGFSVWGGYEGNTVFEGRTVIYDDSNLEWGYEDTEYWTYNTYDFHGVYPTPDANSTNKNYTVTWDNTTKELNITGFDASNNIDLLHAHTPVDNQDGQSTSPVTMNFNHILTNVNVELKKQEEQEIKIVKAAIKLPTVGDYSWSGTNSIKWSVDDEIPAKTLTFDYSAESKTLFNDQYTPIIENLLCIPQEITANAITLRFDYSFSFKPESSAVITENREYYVTLPAGIWNPGDKVVYQGVIDAHMNIVFGAPTVEEWGEDMAGGTIIIK